MEVSTQLNREPTQMIRRRKRKGQTTTANTPSGSSEKVDPPKKKRSRRRGKRRGKPTATGDVPTEQTIQPSVPNTETQERGPNIPRNERSQGNPPLREERSQQTGEVREAKPFLKSIVQV